MKRVFFFKKNIFAVFFVFFIVVFFVYTASFVNAGYSEEYQRLENIPLFGGSKDPKNFRDMIEAGYNFAIYGVGAAAFFMLTLAGFMYVASAGNAATASKAKKMMVDAFLGITAVMFSWFILNVINPDLVEVDKNLESLSLLNGLMAKNFNSEPDSSAGVVAQVGGSTEETIDTNSQYTHEEAVNKLSTAGITVSSSGNCSDQRNRMCTSLTGIPKSTIEKVIAIKNAANCGTSVRVTGGTEVGHKTHGIGKPVIDLSEEKCLLDYLSKENNRKTHGIQAICTTDVGKDARYNCSYVEKTPHFHIQFAGT